MKFELVALAILVLIAAFACTAAMRRFALADGILDVPNERSSHTIPTPRGGGIGIVIAASLGFLILGGLGWVSPGLCAALVVGGAGVALVGFIDDLRGVSAPIRLLVHFGAACAALLALGPLSPQVWTTQASYGWLEFIFMALGVVWSINLFNFMDGIDGLAGTESAFIGAAGALLMILLVDASSDSGTASVVFAAAALGYLWWNWPPARIFMGDVGSGYVGYVIAVLALTAQQEHSRSLLIWSILAGLFVVDATITLIRRLARGEQLFKAHRRHAYQILARRWGSHERVTMVALAVNVLWLLPWAALALAWEQHAVALLVMALTPLVGAAWVLGAGKAPDE